MQRHDPTRQLDAVLRADLESFIAKCFHHIAPAQELSRAWYLRALAWRLQQCMTGEIRRLIITMPPRYLKSICASVAFPAYVLGHDPTKRIVCASYSGELSAKLARDSRAVMSSAWYARLFPNTRLSSEKNAESDFMTTERGYRLSTSVGGTLTGRGGNLIIIDDAMKPDDAQSEVRRAGVNAWFDNTLYSRLDNKKTDVMIVIMQRLHLEDLVGHICGKDEGWTHLDLPAVAEIDEDIPIGPRTFYRRTTGEPLDANREPLTILDGVKRSMGSFNFSAQYQQRPVPPDGELIKWEWLKPYDAVPTGPHRVIQSWDTASKCGELNDYSVCTTWAIQNHNYYVLDVFRRKLQYPELRRAVIDQQKRWNARAILIEDKSSGTALVQDFRSTGLGQAGYPIAIEPEGDKITRAATQSVAIEAGRVFIPRRADWLNDLRMEIIQFPHGRHDDQVDSISQFLKWAERPSQQMVKMKLGGF